MLVLKYRQVGWFPFNLKIHPPEAIIGLDIPRRSLHLDHLLILETRDFQLQVQGGILRKILQSVEVLLLLWVQRAVVIIQEELIFLLSKII